MIKSVWLVVRANGDVRVTKRSPRLAVDEVGVRLNVVMPAGWGEVIRSVDVAMPAPPIVSAEEEK